MKEKLLFFKKDKENKFPFQSFLVNSKNQVVGYFVWDKGTEAHAGVCEFLDDNENSTCANEYYYWNGKDKNRNLISGNPRGFQIGSEYTINQDEGRMHIKPSKFDGHGHLIAIVSNIDTESKTVRSTFVKFVEK